MRQPTRASTALRDQRPLDPPAAFSQTRRAPQCRPRRSEHSLLPRLFPHSQERSTIESASGSAEFSKPRRVRDRHFQQPKPSFDDPKPEQIDKRKAISLIAPSVSDEAKKPSLCRAGRDPRLQISRLRSCYRWSSHILNPIPNQRDGFIVNNCSAEFRHEGAGLARFQAIKQNRLIGLAGNDAVVASALGSQSWDGYCRKHDSGKRGSESRFSVSGQARKKPTNGRCCSSLHFRKHQRQKYSRSRSRPRCVRHDCDERSCVGSVQQRCQHPMRTREPPEPARWPAKLRIVLSMPFPRIVIPSRPIHFSLRSHRLGS